MTELLNDIINKELEEMPDMYFKAKEPLEFLSKNVEAVDYGYLKNELDAEKQKLEAAKRRIKELENKIKEEKGKALFFKLNVPDYIRRGSRANLWNMK